MERALPGDDLIRQGLEDLSCGRETAAAWLVAIGARRLGRLGYDVPDREMPEHRLSSCWLNGTATRPTVSATRARAPADQLRKSGRMRRMTDAGRLDMFMRGLAEESGAGGRVYFTGGRPP